MAVNYNQELKLWEAMKRPHPYSTDVYLNEILYESFDDLERVVQIQHEDNEVLTIGQLKDWSVAIAQNLTKLGIQPDDIVAIACRNSNFVTSLINGAALIGAIIFPLSYRFDLETFKHLFGKTKPKLIICDEDVIPTIQKTFNGHFRPLIYATSGENIPGVHNASELLEKSENETEFKPPKFEKKREDKIAAIICSSASTGPPKCVTKTHFALTNVRRSSPGNKKPSVNLTYSEAFWLSGFFMHIYSAFTNDLRVWTNKPFSVESFIEIVEKYKVTDCSLSPFDISTLMDSKEFLASDHVSLRSIVVVGSSMSGTLRNKFKKIFPDKELQTFYGSTECSVSLTKGDEYFTPNSVGSIIYSNRCIKIVDELENRLGPNEIGEIRVKMEPQFPVNKLINLKFK